MKMALLQLSISTTMLFSACNQKQKQTEIVATPEGTPVETVAPNTSYKPAFAGQTRIKGVKTKTLLDTKILTKDLKKPWGLTSLPDGRLLITQKAGTMRIVNALGQMGAEISGIPTVNDNGQGGLLDVAVAPDFDKNRMIYWTFSDKTAEGNLTAVTKGRLSKDEKKIENAVVIYRATPAYKGDLHYGSRLLFDKTGHIIFSTGERSDMETRPQAQQLNSALGKIIRITVDGKPAGTTFPKDANARPELYSYGHRNVQGLALHPVTGDLWESEFGPRGGDEINRIEAGKNYGWPTITYGIEYDGKTIGKGLTKMEGMEQPVYYWDPVASPSGMTFYNGDAIPEWNNNLFIGGLSSQHVIRLVLENNKVVGEERLLAEEQQRFRDVTQGTDGALYAITDSGRLYRISKK